MTGTQILSEVFASYWKKMEDMRVNDALKLWDWYYNEKAEIENYIKEALGKTFPLETLNRMNIRIFNRIENVISKLCSVYKKTPIRILDGGIKVITKEGEIVEEQSKDDIRYQDILSDSTVFTKAKEWHKLGKCFNTILVQPVYVEDAQGNGYFDFKIHTPAFTVVEVADDNYFIPSAFYYPAYVKIGKELQYVLVYWSSEEKYYIGKNNVQNNVEVNPYGILPIAVLRFREGIDFWGEGKWNLGKSVV